MYAPTCALADIIFLGFASCTFDMTYLTTQFSYFPQCPNLVSNNFIGQPYFSKFYKGWFQEEKK